MGIIDKTKQKGVLRQKSLRKTALEGFDVIACWCSLQSPCSEASVLVPRHHISGLASALDSLLGV